MRICVISPFVDKQHGTERALAELLERLALRHQVQIDLYSQRVSGISVSALCKASDDKTGKAAIRWHEVSAIPGPHLFRFVWWYFANRRRRNSDYKRPGETFDLIYSPGINAPDVDGITVHITFHAFYELVRGQLKLAGRSPLEWPRTIHRKLYYKLIMALERRVYSNSRVALSAVSQIVSDQLHRYFGRTDVLVVRHGVDLTVFNLADRIARRDSSRAALGIAPEEFALLLIGNDWKIKGLDTLLTAFAACRDLPFKALIVGKDSREPYLRECKKLGIESRVEFLEPSADVMQFYAAADAYVGPSLEDAYGLPILEAMACGLPVIASAAAGASEIISDGENGLILRDPQDSPALAVLLRKIATSPELRNSLANAAEKTAARESWDAHADRMFAHFEEILERKRRAGKTVSI
ncbi:MAG: hypothetical protein NVS9B14_01360 [Candidatus Acidiferrum sp.]